MAIIFRPNRATLVDSLAEAMEFVNEEQLKTYVCKGYGGAITEADIVISADQFMDERIGWMDARYVLTKRMGDQDYIAMYGTPQAIGTCATIYPNKTDDEVVTEVPLPMFTLGEVINIRSAGMQLKNMEIIRRVAHYDFDKGLSSTIFMYDIKRKNTQDLPWTGIVEEILLDMIREYKRYDKKDAKV
jgi:hypothetical protein